MLKRNLGKMENFFTFESHFLLQLYIFINAFLMILDCYHRSVMTDQLVLTYLSGLGNSVTKQSYPLYITCGIFKIAEEYN